MSTGPPPAQRENGRYRMTITMPPSSRGSYRYRALAEGYEEAVSDSIPFEEGEVTVDFKLKPKEQ